MFILTVSMLAACGGEEGTSDSDVEQVEASTDEGTEDEEENEEDTTEEEMDSEENTEDSSMDDMSTEENTEDSSMDDMDTEESTEETMGDESSAAVPEELEAEVIAVVEENLKLAEEEDYEAYMNMNAEQAVTEQLEAQTQALFENYELDYELEEISVRSASEEQAVVEVVQKTMATDIAEGYQFQNNRVNAIHTLIKEDGEYKFAQSQIVGMQNLDENGEPM
ncbi:hypothetical protein ACFQ2J_13580 [Thalassobacillus hwangdonensis]|uniref:Uncharacterized protein n=2 Tax=Thalassobacillus hwangdonensis TaxID=546108 RepID=A0ABW3L631_9BACI